MSKSDGIHLLPSENDRFPGPQAEKFIQNSEK
jgi:hypothetical protein